MNNIKILFFTAGTERLASSRTRVYQYLPYLKNLGIGFKVINFVSDRECRANMCKIRKSFIDRLFYKAYSALGILKLLLAAKFFDVVVIQKVILPDSLQRILQLLNRNLVFDFDDAIFINEIYKDNKFVDRFVAMARKSKCIFLENDFTAEFGCKYNSNIVTITGPIDVNRYTLRSFRNYDKTVIGWIGSQDTIGYLTELYPVLRRLSAKYKVLFEVIGARSINIDGAEVLAKEWDLQTEVGNLHDFDIGIMPLPDDSWSRGKGGYKLLQYMAIGIPSVASAVGVNKKIIRDGINGYLATDNNQWEEKLGLLLENKELRIQMGRRARDIAVKEYSFEANIDKFVSALKAAAN